MKTYTFNNYLDLIGEIVERRTNIQWNNNYDEWYISVYYRPLNWYLHIDKELLKELYDMNASAEFGYYCARRHIETHFVKVLYKNETEM